MKLSTILQYNYYTTPHWFNDQYSVGRPVSECQTVLRVAATRDDAGDDAVNWIPETYLHIDVNTLTLSPTDQHSALKADYKKCQINNVTQFAQYITVGGTAVNRFDDDIMLMFQRLAVIHVRVHLVTCVSDRPLAVVLCAHVTRTGIVVSTLTSVQVTPSIVRL